MARALGKLDLLGLKDFGPGMSPIWGTLIGGGTAATTTLIMRHTAPNKYPEAVGLATGLATAGVMFAMKSTKRAALGAAVGAILTSGLALFEKHVLGATTVPAPVAAAGAAVAGMGIPQINALNGLGVPMIQERTPPAGAIPGVAGTQLGSPGQPPVSLLGPGTPQSAHLLGIGGPAVHGLSTAYGATLMGGGR